MRRALIGTRTTADRPTEETAAYRPAALYCSQPRIAILGYRSAERKVADHNARLAGPVGACRRAVNVVLGVRLAAPAQILNAWRGGRAEQPVRPWGATVKIAILGGTGDEGLGLAMRWAAAGHEVIIGSRSADRAATAAAQVRAAVATANVAGMANAAATEAAEVVVLSVPYAAQRDTLTALAAALTGKVLVSVVVPLQFGPGGPHALRVEAGSAAEEVRALVPGARIVSAFHNLSAATLMEVASDLHCDVVVCSDDAEAKRTVMKLAEEMHGVRALNGGALAYSRYVEDLTALILAMNRRYKAHASVAFVGIGTVGS